MSIARARCSRTQSFTILDQEKQNQTNVLLEPHDYWIYYVNIDLRHQYGISVVEAQTISWQNVRSGEEQGEMAVLAGYWETSRLEQCKRP